MKNKLLILLAASSLLVGCGGEEGTSQSQEQSSSEASLSESVSISSSEESLSIEESSSEASSEESIEESSSEESSSESSSEEQHEERVFTAQFRSNNGERGVTGDSKKNYLSVLENYFLDGETQLLNSVSTQVDCYSQINIFSTCGEEGKVVEYTTLSLGSGNAYGDLGLTFNYKITNLKVQAQAYNKYFAYTGYAGWSIDDDCVLAINDIDTIELPSAEDEEPEIITQEYNFSEPVDYLDFYTAGEGRIFLHSLEITYLVE